MWGVAKSLLKEIKKEQVLLKDKFEQTDNENQRRNELIDNRLLIVEKKIENFMQEEISFHKEYNELSVEMLNKINEIDEVLTGIKDMTERRINEWNTIFAEKMEITEGAIQKIQNRISDDIRETENNIVSSINEHSDSEQSRLSDLHKKIVIESQQAIFEGIKSISEGISGNLRSIGNAIENSQTDERKNAENVVNATNQLKTEILNIIGSVQKTEDVVSENIEVMNHTLQEMIRNIMALDEGNRLIIAKMLLQDMGE